MHKHGDLILGIDIGGTFIKSGLVTPDGNIIDNYKIKTYKEKGSEYVLNQAMTCINILTKKARDNKNQVLGLGVSVTGQVDYETGTVVGGLKDKIPGWIGTPISSVLQKNYNYITVVDNDGNAAAIGEHKFGVARGYNNVFCFTVGTGIGSGIILDGKIYRGSTGVVGDLGHFSIDYNGLPCECGNRGCLELYVSGVALKNKAKELIKAGKITLIKKLVQGNLDQINGQTIYQAALKEDKQANQLIKKMGIYLGFALTNTINLLGPQLIVVGGGFSKMGELLLQPIRKEIAQRSFGKCARNVKVVRAELQEYSGVIGAAALVLDKFNI